MNYFETESLSVGYHGEALIHDICVSIPKGSILTLVGPNGAGKSTILKSITRHLKAIRGSVYVRERDMSRWSNRELAEHLAVVLTDRISPELMTCRELVAMGRYPHTNAIGKLTPNDQKAVDEALELVHGEELASRDFAALSDGQKQRVLLARAICQDTELIVLDEPTAYLDIRYKVEFLDILRRLAREKGTTILLSLHEIDLACKVSDYLMCVKGDTIAHFGPPDEILTKGFVESLYDMAAGGYDPRYGSVELAKPEGSPRVFVLGGGGCGIPVYRSLQRRQIAFEAGILFENDLDIPVASALARRVFCAPAFIPVSDVLLDAAKASIKSIGAVLDAGCPIREGNAFQDALLRCAKEQSIPVYTSVDMLP